MLVCSLAGCCSLTQYQRPSELHDQHLNLPNPLPCSLDKSSDFCRIDVTKAEAHWALNDSYNMVSFYTVDYINEGSPRYSPQRCKLPRRPASPSIRHEDGRHCNHTGSDRERTDTVVLQRCMAPCTATLPIRPTTCRNDEAVVYPASVSQQLKPIGAPTTNWACRPGRRRCCRSLEDPLDALKAVVQSKP